MLETKKCFKCGETKVVDEFYRHPQMAGGRLNKCKTCAKRDVKTNRISNIDHYKKYDAGRASNPDRVAAREAYEASDKGIAARRKAAANYIDRNPQKRIAHNAVSNALRDGRLIKKPCEWPECGIDSDHAHHEDYDHPLVVIWYCTPHHVARHAEMRRLNITP